MKTKIIKSLSVLLAVVLLATASPLSGFVGLDLADFKLFGFEAAAASSGYLEYEIWNGEVRITDCDKSASGNMVIPSKIDGYPVTIINNHAFENCTGLTNITITDSVTSIGDYAFDGCTGLTSVTIGNSVASIGDGAFEDCTGLTSITIPDDVKSIGLAAFYDTRYYNNSSNWENDVLYIGNHLIEAKGSITGSYKIKSGTKCIADFAFGHTDFTSVTIPDSVTSIGNYAFDGCTGLTSITIGNSVTSIGYYAFYECTGLTSVTIGNSVTSIGDWAFEGCTGLTSITIPDSVTSIGGSAFYSCTGLTSITIGNGVTSIGECAFYGCIGITSITIPDSVTSIGGDAFYGCAGLTSAIIGNSVTSIGSCAFYGCFGLTSITIPDSVESIGGGAFGNCTSLKSITIPDGVTSIDGGAFYNTRYYNNSSNWKNGVLYIGSHLIKAKSIKGSYEIKSGTKCIANGAFAYYEFDGCDDLTGIIIPDSVTSIGDGAFSKCTSLKSIKIGSNVTSIGYRAFIDCTSLTSITIPDSVTSIESEAFYNTGYYNNSSNWKNDVLYIGNHLIKAKSIKGSYKIKSGTKCVANAAFIGCTGLKSITIPDSVTSIGGSAFYNTGYYNNSSNWKNGVLYIGKYLIEAKTSIKGSYEIKSGTKCIAGSAFFDCTSLTSIKIPDSVTIIGDYAFYNCTGLICIEILNKDCEIYSSSYTIPSKAKIIGLSGSTAESYAKEYNRTFEVYGHSYGSWKTIKKATCTETGKKTRTCSNCGKVQTKKIAALGHNYSSKWTVDKAATCTKSGSKSHHCTRCSAKKNVTTIKATGHTYKTTTTKATTSKAGSKVTACTVCGKVKSTTTIAKISSVKLSYTSYTYNGSTKKPTVTVTDSSGNKLVKDTDYTVKYASGRKNVGKYTVTVTFKGNYSGTKTLTFTIKPKGATISKLTAGTKKFTVKLNELPDQITGYQIQYSTSSKMTSATTKTYTTATTTSRTISNLKSAKTYYVRVRTYKTVDGTKIYSSWSSVKNVKTK